MQPEQDRPTVGIAPNNPVFDLPVIVGIEQGLFAKAGLDVSFSATYADREKDQVQTPFMSRVKENLFDSGCADSYNVCEWASIDSLERGKRGGNSAASFYRGGEVISPDLTAEKRKAYYDAENEAVDLINGDFYKYAHHVTAHAKGALQPRELLRAFVHYKHVDYYDATLFDRAYEWMKARGMSEGQSRHAALVVG